MQVRIDGITHKGEGVGRINGKATFIPLAIPGETIEMEIIQERSKFIRGRLKQVLEPSPDRVEPECPHFPTCGGCHFQHVSYEKQLALKRQIVQDNLQRIAGIASEVKPVIASPNRWNYRNKVTWHVREDKLGYYQEGSHDLLPILSCKIISQPLQLISREIRYFLQQHPLTGNGEITVRYSHNTEDSMLVLSGFSYIPSAWLELKSLSANAVHINNGQIRVLWGSKYWQETLGTMKFMIPAASFFQVNHSQAEQIVALLLKELPLTTDMHLVDLYCGVGALTLNLASMVRKVTGIEEFLPSIEYARLNAELNGIENATFYCGTSETVFPNLSEHMDVLMVDPPRAGCHPDVIKAIVHQQPEHLAYVSCNPGTLARDLGRLKEFGYTPNLIQPIDMFPQTYHVECVTLMSRVEK
jgi:23S rRNA (uracil1939-C5)-methyltransferase